MKSIGTKIFLVFFLGLLFFSMAVPAQAALVTCGLKSQDVKETSEIEGACTICDILKLLKNIVDYISFTLVPIFAGVMILVSGLIIVLGGAKPEMVTQGRSMLTNTLIGVAIIYSSYMITNFIIKSVAGESDVATSWFKLDCQVPVPAPSSTPLPGLGELCNDLPKLAQANRARYPKGNAPELNTLISCIKDKLPGKDFGSQATYDSNEICNYLRGDERFCGTTCNHRRSSCHYGGTTGRDGALAVDFGNEKIGDEIIAAAKACGAKSARCETPTGDSAACSAVGVNHIHISAASCDTN
ncbi:MAG: pilin [Patescibacteria group bacterium]